MKILLIGGANTVTNAIITKLNKEKHKVFILTDKYNSEIKYKNVYEKYFFSYTKDSIKEVFESISPDITIFTGAFDSNYKWTNGYREVNYFCCSLYNIMSAFFLLNKGKFIFLSSNEVENITESEFIEYTEKFKSEEYSDVFSKKYIDTYKAAALKNGEQICLSFKNENNSNIVLRVNDLCFMPQNINEATGLCNKKCIEAINQKQITISDEWYSPLYLTDFVEFLYSSIKIKELNNNFYYINSDYSIEQKKMSNKIISELSPESEINFDSTNENIWIEDTKIQSLNNELKLKTFLNAEDTIEKIIKYFKKNKNKFIINENKDIDISKKIKETIKNIFFILLPFIENMVCFIPFFMINNRVTNSNYFARLDCYLIYVLIFAIIYGQQQATFSAILSVCGYFFRQMYERSSFEIILDYNTYVWIAQLMILGLSVGYLKDKIKLIKNDQEDEIIYYEGRLNDIEEINHINTKVKNELETQVINQSDSIGKIFEITSSLDRDEPEEVFFHAAELVSTLMDCKDVALYNVSNRNYARLMSFTSASARKLGNSIEFTKMESMYNDLKNKTVFINRKLEENVPLMATAIMSDDNIQSIIMLWDLGLEKMTLSYSNRLKVIGYLIQNAVVHADKYIDILEHERYINDTNILEPAAFKTLLNAFISAKKKGLADCSIIKVLTDKENMISTSKNLNSLFRNSDYLGSLDDGNLYILLSNTNNESAGYVTKRIKDAGYQYENMKDNFLY